MPRPPYPGLTEQGGGAGPLVSQCGHRLCQSVTAAVVLTTADIKLKSKKVQSLSRVSVPVLAGSESVPPAPWLSPQLEHFRVAYLVLFVAGNRFLRRSEKAWREPASQLRYCGRTKLSCFDVHRNPRRLIRDGSPGRPPRLSHSS